MIKEIKLNNGFKIAYKKCIFNKNEHIFVIYAHGYLSDMNSKKGDYIAKFCKQKGVNFISFDNIGHGLSSGSLKDITVKSLLIGIRSILKLVNNSNNKIILVGSSLGGWISLLAAIFDSRKIYALLLLAPAPDCTKTILEELSYNQNINFNKNTIKQDFKNVNSNLNTLKNHSYYKKETNDELFYLENKEFPEYKYKIHKNFLIHENKYFLLNQKELNIKCKVTIIHGKKDLIVRVESSIKLKNLIKPDLVQLKINPNSTHKLSQEKDLKIIKNSLNDLIELAKNKK